MLNRDKREGYDRIKKTEKHRNNPGKIQKDLCRKEKKRVYRKAEYRHCRERAFAGILLLFHLFLVLSVKLYGGVLSDSKKFYKNYLTVSLRLFPGLNLGTFFPGILISAPV